MESSWITFVPMLVMFALFYFMLIRPQKKAAEQKRQMIKAVQKGDGVVMIGGLHAIVDEVDHSANIVVLDCEGVYLTYELNAIANVKQAVSPAEEVSIDQDQDIDPVSDPS